MTPEIKNPFSKGWIVKSNASISEYLSYKSENPTIPLLSRSDLCMILECSSKWRKGARENDRPTRSTEFGSLFDCLLLQPERLEEYYTLSPETYTNKKGEIKSWTNKSPDCRAWRDAQEDAGRLVCSREELAVCRQAVKLLLDDKVHGEQIRLLLDNSDKQVFSIAEYVDDFTGMAVHVKCLTDIVPDIDSPFAKSLFDLKTAVSAEPWKWKWAVYQHDYHTQAAINLDVYTAATGEDRVDFRHLIVENTPPFEPAKRCLSMEFVNMGRMKYVEALKRFCACYTDNIWPSYQSRHATVLSDGFEMCEPEAKMIEA